MIMDADAVEACLLAAGDERGDVRQRSSNRDSDIDADPGHLTKAPSFSTRFRLESPPFYSVLMFSSRISRA
jgi:hypothetical protein